MALLTEWHGVHEATRERNRWREDEGRERERTQKWGAETRDRRERFDDHRALLTECRERALLAGSFDGT